MLFARATERDGGIEDERERDAWESLLHFACLGLFDLRTLFCFYFARSVALVKPKRRDLSIFCHWKKLTLLLFSVHSSNILEHMKSLFVAFALLPTLASAQLVHPGDETLVDRPDEGIDFPGCYSDLNLADRNGDGFVKQNEYLNFIQEYGKRICFSTDRLTLQQSATFNTLACICRSQEGQPQDCCLGDNAQIPTAGSTLPIAEQTPKQKNYLTSVCKLTDATIDGRCPPKIRDRETPPPGLVGLIGVPVVPQETPSKNGGGMDWWWWLIIAAAILALLCLCCCCVFTRKRRKEMEEEEEEIVQEEGLGEKGMPMEQAPGVAPAAYGNSPEMDPEMGTPRGMQADPAMVPPMGPGAGAYGAAEASDSEEEEEGRKRRGGGNLPPGEEEDGLRIPTAPRLPPPEDPANPPLKLNPIPDKEHESDEWDHPGRDINFPKDKDEMSAGEVEHYEPDGGVYLPEREGKDPVTWKKDWNRQKPEEPDEVDPRKHRIQSGLGEGEVWNKLGEDDTTDKNAKAPTGDVFDWVVESALGVLDKNDQTGNL